MKKYLFFVAILGSIFLGGCVKPVNEWTSASNSLESLSGLEDCTLIKINRGGGSIDRVYRCPNSQTTTRYNCGKGCEANITVTETSDALPVDENDSQVEDCTDVQQEQ